MARLKIKHLQRQLDGSMAPMVQRLPPPMVGPSWAVPYRPPEPAYGLEGCSQSADNLDTTSQMTQTLARRDVSDSRGFVELETVL